MGITKIINMDTPICILDIETTGFEPGEAEIIELFILKVTNGEIIDEFYSLFKPTTPITNYKIHGITDEKVEHSPYISEKTLAPNGLPPSRTLLNMCTEERDGYMGRIEDVRMQIRIAVL